MGVTTQQIFEMSEDIIRAKAAKFQELSLDSAEWVIAIFDETAPSWGALIKEVMPHHVPRNVEGEHGVVAGILRKSDVVKQIVNRFPEDIVQNLEFWTRPVGQNDRFIAVFVEDRITGLIVELLERVVH